jgi:hypothetical protein
MELLKCNYNLNVFLILNPLYVKKELYSNRILASLICILFFSYVSIAQNITGRVVDENNEPMEWVNVVLLERTDSAYIGGVVTQKDGSFSFDITNIKDGIVKLTSIGYTEQIRSIPPTGNLGVISMQPKNIMLGEVVVKSNRPITFIKGTAFVTDVENSILTHAGTAYDVLEHVPMVSGRNGSLEVFGKGAPLIFINGRKVVDMKELSHVNSSDIKTIEVITNPDSKYDASIKSVIRIRTKRPQGDGWGGSLRTQNGFQQNFVTRNQANLKYRIGGLDFFCNFGYLNGRFQSRTSNEMITLGKRIIEQQIDSRGNMLNNEFYGKIGLSYMFNDNHSIGAYYSNGFSHQTDNGGYSSNIMIDEIVTDKLSSASQNKRRNYPRHYTNLYYNGLIGKLSIDLNADYLWKENRSEITNGEQGLTSGQTQVSSLGENYGRMFAQKLILSYPIWKGQIEVGEEYSSSRFKSKYKTNAKLVDDAMSQVSEKNIAGFIQFRQAISAVEFAAGLRYEHISFNYIENGKVKPEQNKIYNNLFPSVSISTMIKNIQFALSYTNKTQRPSYEDLDGTIDYINRFTLEGGNQYLQPENIHSIELMGAWRQFFAKMSFSYNNNPILNTTKPYDASGEVKLITKENLPGIKKLEMFMGGEFKFGFWQPKLNIGLLKQWFIVAYANGHKRLNDPITFVQWQNAMHLPGDIWMNIDMKWMSGGNEDNMSIKPTADVSAKLYKAFFNNRFSISIEVNDVFNKTRRDLTFYNKDVTLLQFDKTNNRSLQLTLQYNFNATRNRYRGNGAGQSEKERFNHER